MYWFWMNIPLAVAFLAAWAGIPLWLVAKHPDTGPMARTVTIQLHDRAGEPDLQATGASGRQEHTRDSRQLAGARL